MRSRVILISALVVVLGSALFLAGMWVGERRTPAHVATTADAHSGRRVTQPRKPEPPSAKSTDKPDHESAESIRTASTKKNIGKVTVDAREFARGEVTDPAGKPLAGAEITIGGAWVTHAVTDSDGKFRIEVPQLEWKPGG